MEPDEQLQMLSERWERYSRVRFPAGFSGAEVAGIHISALDSAASGCICSYVGRALRDPRHGSLDSERIEILRQCRANLDRVLPELEEEAVRGYFEELGWMIRAVLQRIDGSR